MKKIIVMLLSAALLLSAAPFAAFAAEADFESQLPNVSDEQVIIAEQSSEDVFVMTDSFAKDASMARNVNESEPNGAQENADPINYHDFVTGKVDGSDLDAFVLKVTEPSWICVDYFFTNANSLMVLYDSNQNILDYSFPDTANGNGYTGSLRYYASAGSYYLVLETDPSNSTVEYQFQAVKNMVYRVYGATRYDTSFEIADRILAETGQTHFQSIVVACGTNFPDALAGTYLAAQKNAPILLTNGKNIRAINTYIRERLVSGGTVYLLGDSGVVPNGIGDEFTVKRLGGATRYDTNIQILKEAGVAGKPILVCTGTGFADSLSASATGLPILLVKNSLTAAQKELLQSSNGNIYIIGGTSVVSKSVENALKSYGTVTRLGGSNRYETSVLVAKTFFADKLNISIIAYAQNFPDGLCGGPLAYCLNSPLILTAPGKEAAAVTYSANAGIEHGYVLGGSSLINDKTVRKIYGLDSSYPVDKPN